MRPEHQSGSAGRELTLPIRGNTDLQVTQALSDQVALANSTIVDLSSALQELKKSYDEDRQTRGMQKMQIGYLLQEATTLKVDLVEVTDKYDKLQEKYEDLQKKHESTRLKLGTAEFTIANLNRALGIPQPGRRSTVETESKVLSRIANKHSAQDHKINKLSQVTQSQADEMKQMARDFMQAKEDNGKMAKALVQMTCLLGQLNLDQITKEEAQDGYKSILDDMAAGEANESGPSLFSQPMEEIEVEEEILPVTANMSNVHAAAESVE